MSEATPPAASNWIIRISLGLLAALILLPLMLLLSVYLVLRSPLMESHIWPRLQPLIAEQTGFDVQLDHLRIDLLRSVQLQGIRVTQQNSNCGDFSLTLNQVQLEFKLLPLLQNHLEIRQLRVEGLAVRGCLMLDLAQQPATAAEKTQPLDLQQPATQLKQLLEKPPLSLSIQNLQLTPALMDFEVRERQQQLLARWTGELEVNAEVYWDDNGIKSKLGSRIESSQPLQLVMQDQLQLAGRVGLLLDMDLQLQQVDNLWQLALLPSQLDFDLQHLQLSLQQPQQSLQLQWPSYQLKLQGDMQTRLPAADTSHWPLQLQWQMHSQLAEAGLEFEGEQQQLTAQLHHQLTSRLSGEIDLLDLLLDQLSLDITLIQGLDELHLQQGSEAYQIQQAELQLQASSQPLSPAGTLEADLQLSVAQLQSALSLLPLDINQRLQLRLQQDLSSAALLAETQLNQLEILNLDLQLENLPEQLSLKPQLQVSLPAQLASIFSQAEPLHQLGDLQFSLAGQTTAQHEQNLIKALTSNSLVAQLSNQYQLQITQSQGTAVSQGLALPHPLNITLQLHSPYPAIQPDIQLSLQTAGIKYPPLLQPLPVDLQLTSSLNAALTQLDSEFQLHLNHLPFLAGQIRLDDRPQQFSLNSQLSLNLNPDLKNHLAELADLDPLGSLQLDKQLKLTLQHSASSLQQLELSPLDDLQLQWTLDASGKGLPAFRVEAMDSASIPLNDLIFPLHLSGQAQLLSDGTQLQLHNLLLQSGHSWLEQRMSGQLALDGSTAQMDGQTVIHLPTDQLKDLGNATGKLELPWRITLANSNQLSLKATANFQDVSLQLQDLSLDRLNGQLQLNEELLLKPDGVLAFAYLLTPEAFQRVDYNRMEPYLGTSTDISFQQFKWGNLSLGPLHATLPIRQNLLQLQQFNLKLFDGDMTGQFYLDSTPGAWRIGLLSRVSRLDLRQLLPATRIGGYAPVSARTAVEFDLNQRLLEGRVDITDINRTQLLQLLEILDPDHLDPQMNTVRSALRLAHPRWISAEMEYGRLHLTFGLSLFAEPLQVRGLPLSQIIERFGEEALNLTDQLPLEK